MRILVVDDAPFVLKALQDVLEAYGHEVHKAIDGENAVARYEEVNPDIVLMDILMPRLDGINSTKKILKLDSAAKIVAITAVGKVGIEDECAKAGVKSFIAKPFKIKDLLNIIKSLDVNGNEGD